VIESIQNHDKTAKTVVATKDTELCAKYNLACINMPYWGELINLEGMSGLLQPPGEY